MVKRSELTEWMHTHLTGMVAMRMRPCHATEMRWLGGGSWYTPSPVRMSR